MLPIVPIDPANPTAEELADAYDFGPELFVALLAGRYYFTPRADRGKGRCVLHTADNHYCAVGYLLHLYDVPDTVLDYLDDLERSGPTQIQNEARNPDNNLPKDVADTLYDTVQYYDPNLLGLAQWVHDVYMDDRLMNNTTAYHRRNRLGYKVSEYRRRSHKPFDADLFEAYLTQIKAMS